MINNIKTKIPVPLVNVLLLTYNQEKYIAEAIESVLMQETDFNYKIIIGDDCSNDRTNEICRKYKNKYPEKIILIDHKNNLGAIANFEYIFNSSTAKYIAMLDGDDYWTDSLKLQKQIDFLENHSSFSICFHLCEFRHLVNDETSYFPEKLKKNELTIEDSLSFPTDGWFALTSSFVYRRSAINPLPDWFKNIKTGDCAIMLLASLNGNIYFINEDMGTYRQNKNGLAQTKDYSNYKIIQHQYKLFKEFNSHSSYKFNTIILKQFLVLLYQMIEYNRVQKQVFQSFIHSVKYNYLKNKIRYNPNKLLDYIRFWMRLPSFIFNKIN